MKKCFVFSIANKYANYIKAGQICMINVGVTLYKTIDHHHHYMSIEKRKITIDRITYGKSQDLNINL